MGCQMMARPATGNRGCFAFARQRKAFSCKDGLYKAGVPWGYPWTEGAYAYLHGRSHGGRVKSGDSRQKGRVSARAAEKELVQRCSWFEG